jgi:hypothetical protein
MRVQLVDLLAERSVAHPTTLRSVRWAGEELLIEVEGCDWWRPPYGQPASATITLVFRGLLEGALAVDEFDFEDDEALEEFEVRPIEAVGWAQASDWSIYCSGPIPSPLDVYSKLQDFLVAQGSFRGPEDFLNQAERLSAFVALAQSPGFLMARGPECVRALLCAELERQETPHNVVPTLDDDQANFVVRLGRSGFLCRVAEVELPEAG